MDKEKIIKTLENHGERIRRLEERKNDKKNKEEEIENESGRKKSGLFNEIGTMIKEGIFNNPITINEVKPKLEEKGFFESRESVDRIIRRDFCLRKKILGRGKKGKVWKYYKKK